MKVSLIISTYNRPDALELVLMSIEQQTVRPAEVIIADDGSGIDTAEIIKKYQTSSSFRIIHSWHEDKGFRLARSRNKAISLAEFEYIIQIDGDVILHKNFIEDHINSASEGFMVQGSRVLLDELTTLKSIKRKKIVFNVLMRGIKNRKNMFRSKFLSKIFRKYSNSLSGLRGCNMSYFKDDFYKVNGFNNEIEGWGREDSEFVARLFNLGVKRKNVKFLCIQYHLWHGLENRNNIASNNHILNETIDKGIIFCNSGLKETLEVEK